MRPEEIVTRDHLEAGLARARASAGTSDPRGGVHGPGSASWRLDGEVVNLLGAGRAILLQLAHPYVAHAVEQHSTMREDARGRFERTFAGVFAMTFGDLDQAFRAARRVHAIHAKVRGTITEDLGRHRRGDPYQANDGGALLWVHATLIDTVLVVHEQAFGPLDPALADAYYEESKRFAYLFGLPDELLPPDRAAFRDYVDRMVHSDELAIGAVARALADAVLEPRFRFAVPIMRWYRVVTAGLLPDPIRRGFRLPFEASHRAVFRATLPPLAAAIRAMPRQLRYLPGFLEAEARLGLLSGRPIARLADRLAIATIWPRLGLRPAAARDCPR